MKNEVCLDMFDLGLEVGDKMLSARAYSDVWYNMRPEIQGRALLIREVVNLDLWQKRDTGKQ
jgi:hypothetical protein